MRKVLLLALILGGCSSLPDELRDPEAHVRAVNVQTGAASESVERVAIDVETLDALPCEAERLAALEGASEETFAACLMETGEARRAVYVLEGSASPLLARARVLAGDVAADEVELNALIIQTPDNPALWTLLGREYERQGRDAEAVEAFLRARSLS